MFRFMMLQILRRAPLDAMLYRKCAPVSFVYSVTAAGSFYSRRLSDCDTLWGRG